MQKKHNKGVLGRWAAGTSGSEGKSPERLLEEAELETLTIFRESVLWYLGRKLEEVAEVQRGMMERRLEREVERGRSVLYKAREGAGVDFGQAAGLDGRADRGGGITGGEKSDRKGGVNLDDDSRREIEQQLSPEQLQLFATENQDMLKQYEDTLDQVR